MKFNFKFSKQFQYCFFYLKRKVDDEIWVKIGIEDEKSSSQIAVSDGEWSNVMMLTRRRYKNASKLNSLVETNVMALSLRLLICFSYGLDETNFDFSFGISLTIKRVHFGLLIQFRLKIATIQSNFQLK